MKIKGIIFDFDGTLFDSMSIWESAGVDYLAGLGLKAEEDLSQKIKPLSLKQAAQYLQKQYALNLSVEQIMNGINKTVEDFYFQKALPKENVVAFLDYCQSKGIQMCIATATDRYQIEAALKRCDLEHYFKAIFTCSEVGHSKKEPHIYECARKHLKTDKADTAAFEDAYHAAKTAKAANFYVVGVYDLYERHAKELKETADVYISNFSEAEKMLEI